MESKIIKTKSAGGVVINSSRKVLIVNQNGNSWSLPKGHIEKDEDALTAAKREIWEEAGIKKLELVKKLGAYKRFKIDINGGEDKSELKEITFFLFKTDEQYIVPQDAENPEGRWVNKDEVVDYLTHTKDKVFFLKIINKI